jgi:hypothetical protein
MARDCAAIWVACPICGVYVEADGSRRRDGVSGLSTVLSGTATLWGFGELVENADDIMRVLLVASICASRATGLFVSIFLLCSFHVDLLRGPASLRTSTLSTRDLRVREKHHLAKGLCRVCSLLVRETEVRTSSRRGLSRYSWRCRCRY